MITSTIPFKSASIYNLISWLTNDRTQFESRVSKLFRLNEMKIHSAFSYSYKINKQVVIKYYNKKQGSYVKIFVSIKQPHSCTAVNCFSFIAYYNVYKTQLCLICTSVPSEIARYHAHMSGVSPSISPARNH